MYYITVSNGLLEGNHQEKMGTAVWQYMWCLDKITKIDDDGKGWVLGGKPIKLEEFGKLKMHFNTTSRNLAKLEKNGYIETTRTPYGMVIKVLKAKKRFTKNSDSPKTVIHDNDESPTANSESPHGNGDYKEDITVDSTDDNTKRAKRAGKKSFNPLGAEVIKEMEAVDPKNKTYYSNTTQRGAADFLIEEYGLEAVKKRISVLTQTNKMQYFPSITTPHELKEKWVKLQDAVDKYKLEKKPKSKVAFS